MLNEEYIDILKAIESMQEYADKELAIKQSTITDNIGSILRRLTNAIKDLKD